MSLVNSRFVPGSSTRSIGLAGIAPPRSGSVANSTKLTLITSVALIGTGNGSFGACAPTHAPMSITAAKIRMNVISVHDLPNHPVPLIQDEDPPVGSFAVSKIGARRRLPSPLFRLRLDEIEQGFRLPLVIENDTTNRILAAVLRQRVSIHVKHLAR